MAIKNAIKAVFAEINLQNKEWLIGCSYNPNKALIANHMALLNKNNDIYTTCNDNLLFWGDFNVELEDALIKNVCLAYSLTSMVNKPLCYRNSEKPFCIDLILANCPRSFPNSCVTETGLSDFHNMATTVMKTTFRNMEVLRLQFFFFFFFFFAMILSGSLHKVSFHRM